MKPNRFAALKQKRVALHAEATAISEKETPTPAETERLDAILKQELPACDAELDRFEALQAADRKFAVADGASIQVDEPNAAKDPKRGFRDLGEFALAVRAAGAQGGHVDPRFNLGAAPTNYHKEVGSDEGRMVPPAFKADILEAIREGNDSLLAAVDSEPTESNSVGILRDESTPWVATGLQAAWRSEGVQMSASKLATGEEAVKLHELYAFVLATGELLQDAARLADRLTRKAGLALRYKINEAIVNGTGAGQPLGWFTSAAKVSVAKETSQVAATIVAANVAKMYARLIDPGQGVWYMNQDCLPQLFTMVLGSQPIWIPPSGSIMNAPTGGFLFGRPVVALENCQTVGTVGDIQFVNPKGYYAATKGSAPEFAESMHLFFDYNIQAFRWIFRVGGQPYLSAAVSPAKGSTTRAHVVTLDTRS